MGRILCIGDIHGGYKSMMQCLERSQFDYTNDTLICLGDVADGWPETPQCIEELLKIKNLIYIIGNHDIWVANWFKYGNQPLIWTSQGGVATINAYKKSLKLEERHSRFFDKAKPYHIDGKNRLFVHGGYNPNKPIENQIWSDLYWDRNLFYEAIAIETIHKQYHEIYIGHTTTWNISKIPLNLGNVWMLDQGGGYEGELSIINVDTHEFWQSDKVDTLYPNHFSRR
jgi:serine/threonine protein phosphatase 1